MNGPPKMLAHFGSPLHRLRRSRSVILDPSAPPRPPASSFTNVKETTMTNALEIHIEMLRAELRHCDPAERPEIEAELAQAYAELEVIIAEVEDRISSEPPF